MSSFTDADIHRGGNHRRAVTAVMLATLLLFDFVVASGLFAKPPTSTDWVGLGKLIGQRDAAVVADPAGRIVLARNIDQLRVPASTLKLLTALTAIHFLDRDHLFTTEFYLDPSANLKIKGFGDPLLVSEVLADIAQVLGGKLPPLQDIIMDDSFFGDPLTIPGVTASLNPYDAPNGALCVNFNTVFFHKAKDGSYSSAEQQTPLVPYALKLIRQRTTNPGRNRIILSHQKHRNVLYAGHLFQAFLESEGIQCRGTIRRGRVDETTDKLIYRHKSRFDLDQVIAKLMEFSNNFIANQLLISAGAAAYGPPGNLTKGVKAAVHYLHTELKLADVRLVEGSGISRANKISARAMLNVLDRFTPLLNLLTAEDGVYFKTGTLSGISTRAGYVEDNRGDLYRFVVFYNTPGKSAQTFVKRLKVLIR